MIYARISFLIFSLFLINSTFGKQKKEQKSINLFIGQSLNQLQNNNPTEILDQSDSQEEEEEENRNIIIANLQSQLDDMQEAHVIFEQRMEEMLARFEQRSELQSIEQPAVLSHNTIPLLHSENALHNTSISLVAFLVLCQQITQQRKITTAYPQPPKLYTFPQANIFVRPQLHLSKCQQIILNRKPKITH